MKPQVVWRVVRIVLLALALVVCLVVGYRIGSGKFPDGIPNPRLLTSEVFWATLVGAIVGGIFTVIGGYFGSRLIVVRERERERNELVGAIQVTRTEMAGNMTLATLLVGADSNRYIQQGFSNTSYRSVEHVLAAGLPSHLFGWINSMSTYARRIQTVIEVARTQGGLSNDEKGTVQDLRDRLGEANNLLRRYLMEVLRVKVPELPLQGGETAPDMEKLLRQLLFGDKN